MTYPRLTPDQISDYDRDGYVIARQFFSPAEVENLYATATSDDTLSQHAYGVVDQSGKQSKLALWFTPGDDLYGLMTRSERMVESVKLLLGDNSRSDGPAICHFHSKLMMKEPKVGGAWDRTADAVASGLRLLVQKSVSVSRPDAVGNGRLQPGNGGKRLFAGDQRLT